MPGRGEVRCRRKGEAGSSNRSEVMSGLPVRLVKAAGCRPSFGTDSNLKCRYGKIVRDVVVERVGLPTHRSLKVRRRRAYR